MGTSELANTILKTIENRMAVLSQIIIAKVKTPPPSLTLEYGGQIIPTELLYCSNYLLPNYRRDYKIVGTIDTMHQEVSSYSFNNTTSTATASSHSHGIPTLAGSGTIDNTGNYETHGQFWFTDTLVAGVEVLCVKCNDMYVVIDRIIKMPNNASEGGA